MPRGSTPGWHVGFVSPDERATSLMISSATKRRDPREEAVESCRNHLGHVLGLLLRIVQLESGGRPIEGIHSLRWKRGRDRPPVEPSPRATLSARERARQERKRQAQQERAGFQPIRSILAAEPRIVHISRLLDAILSLADVEVDRTPIAVDGFRLRHPRHWLVRNQDVPFTLSCHLGRTCNIHCEFCYVEANPPTLAMARSVRTATDSELDLRLSLYDREGGRELFQSHYQLMEVLCHERSVPYLRRIRELTPRTLSLTTAGSSLTRKLISELRALRPLRLWLSLNLVDPDLRRKHLADRNGDAAVAAMKWLEEDEISFCVSVVPIPGLPIESMVATLRRADRFRPAYMRVILPGFTRFDRPAPWHESWKEVWHRSVQAVRALRPSLKTPVVIYPQIFEELHYDSEWNGVKVLGAVRGSPAARAGLEWGSWIRAMDGRHASCRDAVRDTLLEAFLGGRDVELEVDHRGRRKRVKLSAREAIEYPFSEELVRYHVHTSPYGIILGGGLRPEYFEGVERLALTRGARDVWFVSSPLMAPLARDMAGKLCFPRRDDVRVSFVEATSRFMGGNVVIGEMMSCRDFYHAIEEEIGRKARRPDLVVLPETPLTISNGWKRDLEGVYFKDLERALGIPVELLACDEIKF